MLIEIVDEAFPCQFICLFTRWQISSDCYLHLLYDTCELPEGIHDAVLAFSVPGTTPGSST